LSSGSASGLLHGRSSDRLVAEVVLSGEVEQHVEVLAIYCVDRVLDLAVVVTDGDVVENHAVAVEHALDTQREAPVLVHLAVGLEYFRVW
jgi:hypothetical protein